METHYLVDYENDGKNSVKGYDELKKTDHIHILYTNNYKGTTFDIFTNHGEAELDIKKVPVGSESLDKHLIAYLGYLVGKNSSKQMQYVIVSSDKGYDNVGKFLRDECNRKINVVRRRTIADNDALNDNKVKPKRKISFTVSCGLYPKK